MPKLFIDLGHSNRFPGASGIMSEVTWNRSVWKALKPKISLITWKILEVPTSFITDWSGNRNLINRISWINKQSNERDFLLSIHANAASNVNARGVTTCYMGGSEAARLEAVKLSETYAKITGVPVWNGGAFDDRNSRFGRLGMVRDTKPFALLIEAGFCTNAQDMKVDPEKAAEAIANYFNHFSL